MFVGHYSVSYALRTEENKIPLWVLFLAVQLIDIFWGIFVLLGLEKVRIIPGFTASNPLDLYYMPYTHSLIGVLCWSGLAFGAYGLLRKSGRGPALLVALAVFSHWILDLVVHRPDLALFDDTMKVGFGLWDYRLPAFVLEIGLLTGGVLLYLKRNAESPSVRKSGTIIFLAVMILIQAFNVFAGRPVSTDRAMAASAIFSYLALALVAFLLERKRKIAAQSAAGVQG